MTSQIVLLLLGIAAIAGLYFALRTKASPVTEANIENREADDLVTALLPEGERRVVPESIHNIPRHALDDNAMRVVYRLLDNGYDGYLVGGCVRDLLVGKNPKDFDVATSATPEQAEPLFNRARLIGRRFKIVHVRFGREVIEVTTFRAGHDSVSTSKDQSRQAASGMLLRDNVYGTIEEDAKRRDFSINALYYNVEDNSVYDFANGYPDLLEKRIRIIGDAEERYREDPVRMLRAARFAAKLSFDIDPDTAQPIHKLGGLISKVAPARMFDEVLKLLQTGYGEACLRQLLRFDLFKYLLPATDRMLGSDEYPVEQLVNNALRNTDRRLAQDKSVNPAFLFAAMLWYPLVDRMRDLEGHKDLPPLQRLHEAANQILGEQVRATAIPRRFSTTIREIWEMQHRLMRRDRADQLMEHPRFRAGYDLLVLREESGEDLNGISGWWTEYQNSQPNARPQIPAEERRKRSRRRRPNRKPKEQS